MRKVTPAENEPMDITSLRSLETEHLNEKDYCNNLLNQLSTLIWRTDEEMNCNYVNKSWVEFTGMSLEKTIAHGWAEVLHPEDLDRWIRVNTEAVRTKEPFSLGIRILRYDGEYRWCINVGRPYYDLHGKFAGFVGVIHDITGNKQAAKKIFEKHVKYRSLFMNMNSGCHEP